MTLAAVLQEEAACEVGQIRRRDWSGRLIATTDVGRDAVPQQMPDATTPMTVLDWLFRLDSVLHPCLTRSQFRKLFAICLLCSLTMTKRVFLGHECAGELGDQPFLRNLFAIDYCKTDPTISKAAFKELWKNTNQETKQVRTASVLFAFY
jgi:hypothetical protein